MADIDPGLSPARAREVAAQQMLERMVAHAAANATDRSDGPLAIPATLYTCPDRFALEQQKLFRELPLVAGLTQDIPNPDLDGKLIAQPGKAGFEGHPEGQRDLLPVPAREWNGLIFVQPEGEMDLETHLADFAPVLAMLELDKAEPVKRGHMDCAANWKYALDTYGEGYHFASLHPNNIGITHMSDVGVFDAYGRHHRISFPTKAMAELASTPPEEWPTSDYGGVLFRLFPHDVGHMRCQFAVYAPGGVRDEAHRRENEMGFDLTKQVVETEDYRQSEQSFANLLAAPPGFNVVLGSNEIALQRLQRNIADVLGVPLE